MTATRVLLVGLVAAGRSSVCSALSAVTGWPVLDDDVLLQRSTGRTAGQLLAAGGSRALRSAESDVLTLTLSMPPPLVAGIAPGTVLDPRDRDRLRAGGHVVWLQASVATLVRRLAKQSRRPFGDDDPAVALREMAAERDPLFAGVAHQVLDMDLLTPAQAARQVVSALELGGEPVRG
jgi:shikimate kinase